MPTEVIQWEINYAAVFAPLPAKKREAWQEFLDRNISSLDPREIDVAVASLCDTWSDTRNHPGVLRIKSAINRARYENSDKINMECEGCHGDGWITFPHAFGEHFNGAAIPCVCPHGRKHIGKYPESSRNELMRMARTALIDNAADRKEQAALGLAVGREAAGNAFAEMAGVSLKDATRRYPSEDSIEDPLDDEA
jgi:hypothetical protein